MSIRIIAWLRHVGSIATMMLLGVAVAVAGNPPGANYPAALRQALSNALAGHGPNYEPRTEHLLDDGTPVYTNRLILEDSPYLLQHAHNPVDWYAWGPAAFEKSRQTNKPIFLSIGYSTCHWCHVMERESFEDLEVAEFINANFVAIKVDRERRPDVDTIYMTAVQLMGQRGGWPMSSFLTPAGDSFFGATYFPRDQFLGLLQNIERAWHEDHAKLEEHAKRVAEAVRQATRTAGIAGKVDDVAVQTAVANLLQTHDAKNGGFGAKPKFPNETRYLFLLDQALRTDDAAVIELLRFDLGTMARGGIYDQIGGGFHRYSTDAEWLVPHFEKMLYNQAALARVYALAFQLTGEESFARVARQTLDYVLRDMTAIGGGFYSATDADSEGAEGLFFLWTPAELRRVLNKDDAELAIRMYGVSEPGNFEASNILHLATPLREFSQGMPWPQFLARADRIRESLYLAREKRVHPLRDEKIVTAWNGMMIVALAEAAEILQESVYSTAAERAGEFLWQTARRDDGQIWRAHLGGRSSVMAVQEDYAWFADACLQLYDLTGQSRWLERSEALVATMDRLFWDPDGGAYFMNDGIDNVTAMARPKDGHDNATASGNAVALRVLSRLAARRADYAPEKRANALLAVYANSINRNPTGYSYMLAASRLLAEGAAGPHQYAARGAVKVGGRFETDQLIVDLEIREGWHINAHKTRQDDLIPTTVALAKPVNGWRSIRTVYPEPILKTLDFETDPLALYEGDVSIKIDLSTTGNADTSFLTPVSVELQACDERVCLPPERLLLKVPTGQLGVAAN